MNFVHGVAFSWEIEHRTSVRAMLVLKHEVVVFESKERRSDT
jgi:hypothetical protein